MAQGNNKYNNFAIILNAPKENTLDEARVFFTEALTSIQNYNKLKWFASIIHDKDILENGDLKRIHLHIVIETYQKTTVLGFLKDFSNYLSINKDLISIEGSNNEFLIVQYLTHKNQPLKTSYHLEQVITNNKEELERRYNDTYIDPDKVLMDALFTSQSLTELIQRLGVEKANKYRSLFNQTLGERRADFESLARNYKSLRTLFENLMTDLILLNLKNDKLNDLLKDYQERLELFK